MPIKTRHTRLIAWLSTAGASLMLLVLITSAMIRLGSAECLSSAAPDMLITIARVIHRISASSIGVLLIAIIYFVLKQKPVPSSRIVLLGLISALTVFLAVLGRFSAGAQIPVVTISNVVAGIALFTLFWRLRIEFVPHAATPVVGERQRNLVLGARSLAGLQIWLGSWMAGLIAGLGCTVRPEIGRLVLWPDASAWRALDPLHAASGYVAVNAINWLGFIHTVSASLVLVVTITVGLQLQRLDERMRRLSKLLLVFLTIQGALGIATLIFGPRVWCSVAHNAFAALLMAVLADIHCQFHRR